MKTTCGVFLFNKEDKFLVAHATNSPNDIWSVPKGLKDVGEDNLTTAIRELYEETNISLIYVGKFSVSYVGEFNYPSNKKKISAFYIETDYDFSKYNIKCDSMVTHLRGKDLPEVDKFKWVTIEESKKILHKSQILAINVIEQLRKNAI